MILTTTLRANAEAKLQDARVLLQATRYDGAFYICGYAVELALKARICDTLKWQGYPDEPREFNKLVSFKVHDLETLLLLSGIENAIKTSHFSEWSLVKEWKPERRYKAVGQTLEKDAHDFIQAAQTLLSQI